MKKAKKVLSVLSFLLVIILFNSCEDYDDNLTIANVEDIIQQNSDLYKLLERLTTVEQDPLVDIVCIDFIYPISLQIYNENLIAVGTVRITGDDNFSEFLGALPDGKSLSISYPISTTLADNSEFTINNNADLKLAIDSCSREDLINYCGDLLCSGPNIPCVWQIQYKDLADNKYVSGYFDAHFDGTISFFYDGETYNGTWLFFFINDEFHLNINLAGTSQVALDWNIDCQVTVSTDEIILQNNAKIIHLKQKCQSEIEYQIGSTGPAGGIVFYDKENYNDGWRYMEVALEDLPNSQWGCYGSLIPEVSPVEVGKGLINSARILYFHDTLNNYYLNPSLCNATNDGSVIARKALQYVQNDFIDWFLPSIGELNLIYQNLQLGNLGDFSNQTYWSSSQIDSEKVFTADFATGVIIETPKFGTSSGIKARAIRYF